MFKCQKDDFDQQTACEAPICWSKHTTDAFKNIKSLVSPISSSLRTKWLLCGLIIDLLWEQGSCSVINNFFLSRQQFSGQFFSDASEVQLAVVSARPVRVVVVVGLQGHPFLKLCKFCCVTEDVTECALKDLLFGNWAKAVGVWVGVEEPVTVL